jgi:hypothetical protein
MSIIFHIGNEILSGKRFFCGNDTTLTKGWKSRVFMTAAPRGKDEKPLVAHFEGEARSFVASFQYRFVSSTAISLTVSPGFVHELNLDAIASRHVRARARPVVSVGEGELSLARCLERNAQSEVLDQNNQWFCGHCREFVCAEKTLEVWSVPEVLIVQLKRFLVVNEYTTKSDVNVDYPNVLDMAPFIAGPQGGQDLRYRLYAVSEHSGGLGGGHYTAHAIVRSLNGGRGEWFWFDDSSASADREANAHNTYAYMLFYERLPEDDARTTTGDDEAASYD